MAAKTHRWESELLKISICDGPATGEYPVQDFGQGLETGLLFLGVRKIAGKEMQLKVKIDELRGLRAEMQSVEAARAARFAAAHATDAIRCARCAKKIDGDPICRPGTFRGIRVMDPICKSCARLLRIMAGGVGADGEPFEPEQDDRTPYTKED